MTPEDYSLLSSVLSHGFGGSCQQVAIEERTSPGSVALSSEDMSMTEVAEVLGIDQQLLAQWQNKNSDFDYFDEQFELSCDYHLVSSKELSAIFDNTADGNPETGWRNFRKALPNLVGIMRPG